MGRQFACWIGLAALAALTACGPAKTPLECGKCAPAYHCDTTTGGCVSNGASLDAAPAGDMAMGNCVPACTANQYCNGSNRCAACLVDEHCPIGNICKTMANGDGQCVAGCHDDSRCTGKPAGDGGHGTVACCSGQCTDTGSDAANCSACGMACNGTNAAATCTAGICKLGACTSGYGDCNQDSKDGCEANLRTDVANCTACGKPCAFMNGVPACANGCYLAACNYGFDDCNGDPTDGCETSTLADAANCGSCGTSCKALPNAQVACANATCALAKCNLGFFDCNKMPGDGCEVSVASDARNCGKCGASCGPGLICVGGRCTCQACNIPNASATCMNNQCVFDQCNQGYADCNNNVADGCEVNLNFDSGNCGSCGSVCPMNTPSCGAGQCTTLFTFQGILQNTPVNMLAGWTQCYKDTYNNSSTPVATILANCSKARLLTACRMVGSPTLTLAAMAPRGDVIFDTGMGNVLHVANGVGWYFNDSYSWGFVQAGDTVSRNSCDTGQQNPDKRMCWHTGQKNINSGYRCGANTLNGDMSWERLVFMAD